MPALQRGLFGVISPEGTLIAVVSDSDPKRFAHAAFDHAHAAMLEQIRARPNASEEVLMAWLEVYVSGYKLERLG